MADTLVLEPLKKALKQPPPSMTLPASLLASSVPDDFRLRAEQIIQLSRRWLPNVKTAVAKARRHPEHPTRSSEVWAKMEPLFSNAITVRESFVENLEDLAAKGRDQFDHPLVDETLEIIERILTQIRKEHRGLVEIYYLLKADADEADEETRGQGHLLSSPEDVHAYFKHLL